MREYTTREIDRRVELVDQYERRCAMYFLQESDAGHVPLGDVVSHLQKQDPTLDERDKIEAALYHNHLPQLATIDALDFDPRSEMVRYYGDELVETLLESVPETYKLGV